MPINPAKVGTAATCLRLHVSPLTLTCPGREHHRHWSGHYRHGGHRRRLLQRPQQPRRLPGAHQRGDIYSHFHVIAVIDCDITLNSPGHQSGLVPGPQRANRRGWRWWSPWRRPPWRRSGPPSRQVRSGDTQEMVTPGHCCQEAEADRHHGHPALRPVPLPRQHQLHPGRGRHGRRRPRHLQAARLLQGRRARVRLLQGHQRWRDYKDRCRCRLHCPPQARCSPPATS